MKEKIRGGLKIRDKRVITERKVGENVGGERDCWSHDLGVPFFQKFHVNVIVKNTATSNPSSACLVAYYKSIQMEDTQF